MNGTKRYQHRFGDRLLFVRYRHDKLRQRRLATVELIVDEKPLVPPKTEVEKALFPHPNQYVEVRVDYYEAELRAMVKTNGGKWLPENKRWRLPYHVAVKLGMKDRISGKAVLPDVETNDQ
jgi:hypothetical protein